MEEAKIPALIEFLTKRMPVQDGVAQRRLILDGYVSINGATPSLAEQIERLGPFGQGNPQVRLAVQRVINLRPEIVKEQHVKTLLVDPLSQIRLFAIAFRCADTKLGEALMATRGQKVDIAGQLRLQEWNGQPRLSLQIDDISSPA